MSAANKAKRHVYKTGAAGCGGKSAPVNAKNSGQPIPCPFCDRIFKQDGRFKEHLKNKHPNEEVPSEDHVSDASSSQYENPPSQQQQSTYPVKMPKALLHEWCQKNKRPSPKFMHVEVEGGFQCRVILPDPKKSELDIILWYRNPSPNSQEAHHRAAVMALHHVMGDRRLDRILPEEYRQEWHDLDAAAAEREEKLKQKAQKPKRVPHAPRELQSVFMSERNRKLVEEVLTDKANGMSSKEAVTPRGDIDQIAASLLEMGFRESHVLLALEQTHDVSAALDWLMLHVDESELPAKFAPQSSKAAVRIIQRSTDYDGAGKLVEYGYTYEDSVAAYNETGNMEFALSKLFYDSIATLESHPGLGDISSGDVSEMKEEELVALSSIFPGAVIAQGFMKFDVELPPQTNKNLEMEVRIPADSIYPLQVPVIAFRGKNWDPLDIRRLTQKVAECGLQLLGTAMLYDLLSYATEVATELLLHPARYNAARIDEASIVEATRDQVAQVHEKYQVSVKQKQPRNKHMDEGSRVMESLRLKQEWEALQASAQYADVSAARRRLPAFKQRNEILAGINRGPVSIICGETGCGKSTQVPQYVLEERIETGKGAFCNVICTQPRRISALGLATRVAKERNESVGRMVGYSVRLDSCCSKYTRLLYCTTGILLRRLLSDPELEDVSHIILDEVHERTLESDLLLLLLKNHIQRTGGTFRLILMSATADADMFADYFKRDLNCDSTILRIPGFTFPVRELYLEDVLELTGYRVTRNSKYAAKKKQKDGDSDTIVSSLKNMDSWEEQDWETDTRYKQNDMMCEYSETTKRSLDIVDESIINFELIEKVLCKVFELEREPSNVYGPLTARHEALQSGGSSVLVFLPGMLEIKKLQTRLQGSRELAAYGVESKWILPLHGSLSGEEQKRVFLRPPHSVRKIVLATNVAETSITIDDILYVIDTGRHKEMSYDHYKGLSCLQETWISKASSKQRCGRAGRVQPGCCLRLFSRKQSESLQEQQLPEIQRVSLEGLCLKVKSLLTEWRVENALSKMLSPPDPEAVSSALQSLKDINAFDLNGDNLTPLGKHLAQMPVDARVGKMLIFGCMLKCLDPVLTIAAAMSGRSVFISSQEGRIAKQRLAGGSKSDHIALVSAYNGWLSARSEGYNAEKQFCTLNSLAREALSGIEVSRQDYLSILTELGFYTGSVEDSKSGSARVIKAVVCAGFYPNVARVRHPEKTYVQTEGGTVPKLAAAHEVHYFTKLDGRVFLHPSSVNFSVGHYESPWLVITEKVKTSKVYVRECSMVPAYALLIFGGAIDVRHEKQMIVVDGWVEFEAPARIAVLIKELRKKVDALLLEKTSNPSLDISTSPVVSALLKLLDSDGGA